MFDETMIGASIDEITDTRNAIFLFVPFVFAFGIVAAVAVAVAINNYI
jgi:hypothetical protein